MIFVAILLQIIQPSILFAGHLASADLGINSSAAYPEPRPQGSGRNAAAEKAFADGERLRAEWKESSLRKAIIRFESARACWHDLGDQRYEAIALSSIGDIFLVLAENHKALELFHQALLLSRAAQDRSLEIAALNKIGYINIDFGNAKQTIEYCDRAYSLSLEAGDRCGQAQSLNNIGVAHYALNNLPKALEFLSKALALWEAEDDRRGQAEALLNLGYAYGELGDMQTSFNHINRALPLWRDVQDHRGEALTLTTMGMLYSWLGERLKALLAHRQALQFFRVMGNRSGEASTLNSLGYIYDVLGEKQKALSYYSRSLELYRAVSNDAYAAVTIGYIGRVYFSIGERQKALDFYNQKLTFSRAIKDQRMEAYTLKDIGVVVEALGEKQKALDYYNKALSLSKAISDRRGQAHALNNIGYVYESLGDKQNAVTFYHQALALTREASDRSGETLTLHNIARVKRDLGDLAGANDDMKTLLGIIETLRTKVAGQDLASAYSASTHQHYELYIDILMRMHKQNPNAGFDAAALEISEKARARSLLDLLAEARVDIRRGVDAALLQQEADLQQALNTKAEQQVRLLSRNHTHQEADTVKRELDGLTSHYQEVGAHIRATSPQYSALVQPQTLNLHEIQKQMLDDDTLLLEYSLGEQRSHLWAVTTASMTNYELPGRPEIEAAARSLYEMMTLRNSARKGETIRQRQARQEESDAMFSQAAEKLSRILIGPVCSQIGTKRLVIIADGALHYVPFAALPDPEGIKKDGQSVRPLVANHQIVYLPSISALSLLRNETAHRPAPLKAVAVLADPVFDEDDSRVEPQSGKRATRSSSHSRRQGSERFAGDVSLPDNIHFGRLPFARQEAAEIASLIAKDDLKLAVDFDASRQMAMSKELAQYRTIHFATHGLIYSVHPELTCIVLSLVDQRGKRQNGFLRLNDIYNLKLPVEMVVLSACQSALGKDISGEGLIGLTRGFMYAGASRIVSSLWKVDDRASAELMKHFYKGMVGPKRLSQAAALQAAQVEMLKQERWKSPYYWAAFILQGEWR